MLMQCPLFEALAGHHMQHYMTSPISLSAGLKAKLNVQSQLRLGAHLKQRTTHFISENKEYRRCQLKLLRR